MPRQVGANGAPASDPSGAKPNIVWMLGFPRELLANKLKKFALETVDTMMPGWKDKVVVKAFNLDQKCSVEFDSAYGAHKFLDLSRDDPPKFEMQPIRVRPDRSAEARYKNRIMGGLWKGLELRLDSSGGRYKIGQNGPKGKVFLVDNSTEEVWVIFQITHHGSNDITIEIKEEACTTFRLAPEVARDIVDAAKAGAVRPARAGD